MAKEDKKETPVINMEQKQKEPTKEQLQAQIGQLVERCKEMYDQLQQANMFNTFKRLDYCFKVVENSTHFPVEFVEYCKKDIVTIMTIAEEPSNKDTKEG